MAIEYAKECINPEDGRIIVEALDKLISNQSKKGNIEDIKSAKIAKDALNKVLDRISFEYDEICFYISIGTKK